MLPTPAMTVEQTVALLDKLAPTMGAVIDAEPHLDLTNPEGLSTFLTGAVMNTPGVMGEVIMAATGCSLTEFEQTPLVLSAMQFVGVCAATSAGWPADFDMMAEVVAALLPHSSAMQLFADQSTASTAPN